jgi:cytochrome c-type biogenesis protein CcmF
VQWIDAQAWQYIVLLFAGVFTAVSNLDYIVTFMKGNLKAAGSAVSHLGFGLMIIGTLASGLNKSFISSNRFAQDGLIEGFTDEDYQKNIILLKGVPTMMKGYEVTYEQDTSWNYYRQFKIHYARKDENGNTNEVFDLRPNIIYDKTFTKVAASNPDTKHYWNKDIFTHVVSLPKSDTDPQLRQQLEDSLKYIQVAKVIGDTFFTKQFFGVIESVNLDPNHKDYKREENDLPVSVKVRMYKLDSDTTFTAEPMVVFKDKEMLSFPYRIAPLQVSVRLPEAIIERVFVPDSKLKYQNYNLAPNQEITVGGNKIKFKDFDKNGTHKNYKPEKDDIAVNAILDVTNPKGKIIQARPLFLIRENKPYNIKDEIPAAGLHIRMLGINPTTGTATIAVSQTDLEQRAIPIEVAENSPSNEYIVLQAILFPGINYFWIGSSMMMFGLCISLFRRLLSKKIIVDYNTFAKF